ncbi:MAG: tRNA (adenosine(37)-N6)-threonylcarbamoyltransferase complex transferase subunit TsaD [Epulopiscium sp. Nuni2H_MBin003]|nr:MAG: tRNA (adenosine(37)-N6)-threonylcarbamoyltransferase complex transferase subunit TsaD [Epulopiscium sp. Nuni2H_MBin003]
MKVLAIETSCDETSVAIVNGREVLSNIIDTQIEKHKIFGGVVPEIASRMHIEKINYCIKEALQTANIKLNDIDIIAVTYGPGLVGALLVGLSAAKAIAFMADKPLVGVHHIEGHIAANYLEHPTLEPPFLCLVVSGGHTHLVNVLSYTEFDIVGKTKDDAVGEAYDKVARTIGLKYPGGPKVDELAKLGDPNSIQFPKAMINTGYDFSFSGIKSAVLNYVNSATMKQQTINNADVAASFQKTVVDILTHKTIKYATEHNIKNIAIAGGVAANSTLRMQMKELAEENGLTLYYPSLKYCTDNAAMIGVQGYYQYKESITSNMRLNAIANIAVGTKPSTGFN